MAGRQDSPAPDFQRPGWCDEPLGAGNRRRHFAHQPVPLLPVPERKSPSTFAGRAGDCRAAYEAFARKRPRPGRPIQTGEFGADMKGALINDGPVTISMIPEQGVGTNFTLARIAFSAK